MKRDFSFLFPIIRSFKGELEFSIRDNYFNLYSRGFSAAKVIFKPKGRYQIEINEKFFPSGLENDERFSGNPVGHNRVIETSSKFLHPLLQKKYLSEIYAKIKKTNFNEELNFEQMVIADNADRSDLILIDRQVTDSDFNKRRMDLLALRQQQGNKFRFLVLEAKMGNNPELKDEVANQLNSYITHISDHFVEYKSCYEKYYSQKKILGLLPNSRLDEIDIVPHVEGMIIVGGYSGLAKEQIEVLRKNYPDIKIQSFFYDLNFSDR